VTSIIESFLKMNIKGRIGAFVGIVASISGIILWVISNFFNPYVVGISKETIPITFTFLGLPAILGFIASLYGTKGLMYVVFIGSLPLSLYLAGTPGIFRFFLFVSLGYLVSAILLTMNKENKNQKTS